MNSLLEDIKFKVCDLQEFVVEHYGHKKKENEYSKKYDTLLLQLLKVNQKPLVRFLNQQVCSGISGYKQ